MSGQLADGNSDRGWRATMRAAVVATSKALVVLAFVAAAGAGTWLLYLRAAGAAPPQAYPPIPVATVFAKKAKSYAVTTQFVGRLEPQRQTNLAFERSGLVLKVLREEGEAVQANDVVAVLDVDKLKARRRQLVAQQKELDAQRTLAKLTLKRQRSLRQKGWAPDQKYDEAVAGLARFAAAIDRVAAQIAELDIDIRKSHLKAPFDGRISRRVIDEGAVVAAGMPVVTLLESSRRQVRVGVPPHVAGSLKSTANYQFRSGSRRFSGTLAARRPDLQASTRTVSLLFNVAPGGGVPFGELVTLELEQRIAADGYWLPLTALREGHKGLWTVLVATSRKGRPARIIETEAVEVLHTAGGRVFVRGTLRDGARVVVNGTHRVTPGQRVVLAVRRAGD